MISDLGGEKTSLSLSQEKGAKQGGAVSFVKYVRVERKKGGLPQLIHARMENLPAADFILLLLPSILTMTATLVPPATVSRAATKIERIDQQSLSGPHVKNDAGVRILRYDTKEASG